MERAWILAMHTHLRRPVFLLPAAAHAVVRMRARTLPFGRATWLAWVLMPDHWMGLVVGVAGVSPHALAGRFKAMTAREVAARVALEGSLWEPGCGVREIAPDAPLADAAHDLVATPRRAGLVACLRDYPYWASAWPVPSGGEGTEGIVAAVSTSVARRLIDYAGAPTIARCRSP
jgi:hypothetical protein